MGVDIMGDIPILLAQKDPANVCSSANISS